MYEKEPQDRVNERELTRGCLFVVVTVGAIAILYPLVSRWVACQQLAPIERIFVPGC